MTKIRLITGIDVYTELPVWEVRMYLQGGSMVGTFDGYTDETKATKILIAAQSVVFVYYA